MGGSLIMLTLKRDKILLVEGKDEVNFFNALLEHQQITDVQVIEIGGKDKFKSEFPAFITSPGFDHVKIYSIIRDADKNVKDTFQSIKNILRKYDQPIPNKIEEFVEYNDKKVGIFIMPGNKAEGMLEDLCLTTVSDHPIIPCIDSYIKCIEDRLSHEKASTKESTNFDLPRNISKSKAHIFISSMPELVNSVGLAALKGYLRLAHPSLNDLKKFLSNFK